MFRPYKVHLQGVTQSLITRTFVTILWLVSVISDCVTP
jgi:hypothetical protein